MFIRSRSEALTVSEEAFFSSGNFLLHGELAYPEEGQARGAVVIAGPHPLLGGDMRNNVVRGLGNGLAEAGLLTLRFDYRGVGRSQGPEVDVAKHMAEFWKTSHTSGEMDFWQDLQSATEHVRRIAPGLPMAIVGYSFGCALLPHVHPQEDISALVAIAPTVAKHDYNTFHSVKSPLLVIASEDDFATDNNELEQWYGKLPMPRQLTRKKCDNHFFRGHEDWLVECVSQFLQENWSC